MPSLYHDVTNDVLTGVGRAAFLESDTVDPLRAWFPEVRTLNLEYELRAIGRQQIKIAAFRARNAESQIAGRQKAGRTTEGEIPPISQKSILNEEDLSRLQSLSDANDATRRAVARDAVNRAQGVAARIAIARAEAIFDGQVTFTYETGFGGVVVDYQRDASREDTAATVWSDTAAEIGTDLIVNSRLYRTQNGSPAGAILMRSETLANVLANDQINVFTQGSQTQPNPVAPEDLVRQWMARQGLPPIVVMDHQYYDVDAGTVTALPLDAVVWVPPPGFPGFAATVFAPPVRARQTSLVGTDAAGLIVDAYDDEDPVGTWTRATAYAVPVVGDPDRTLKLTVE